MHGTQTSMTVGLVAVVLSTFLGVLLGGSSGYLGGKTDSVIQRLIELLQSVPTIPIWLALAAALPRNWTPTQVFFAITVILSLIGWTTLGREVRGRFLALREEDFVLTARLAGCSRLRIILRHMVPTFASHIIATASLAIPVMIINETSLSFMGLGIRSRRSPCTWRRREGASAAPRCARRSSACSAMSASRCRSSGWMPIPGSSPAGCASAP